MKIVFLANLVDAEPKKICAVDHKQGSRSQARPAARTAQNGNTCGKRLSLEAPPVGLARPGRPGAAHCGQSSHTLLRRTHCWLTATRSSSQLMGDLRQVGHELAEKVATSPERLADAGWGQLSQPLLLGTTCGAALEMHEHSPARSSGTLVFRGDVVVPQVGRIAGRIVREPLICCRDADFVQKPQSISSGFALIIHQRG